MKAVFFIYGFIVLALVAACSKQLDNHKAPNASISGAVTDGVKNQPFQTEQPNGVKIRLIEESYSTPTPLDFWTRPDGTFTNAQIFSGKYKVVATEGAFFPVDTLEVNVNGSGEANFTVTPFLAVDATATVSANSVILNYHISRTRVGDKIIQAKSLASQYPSVSNIVNEVSLTHDLSGMTDTDAMSYQFSDTLKGLTIGNTYYTRVAARTNNANNKYNYSPVMEVKIQ